MASNVVSYVSGWNHEKNTGRIILRDSNREKRIIDVRSAEEFLLITSILRSSDSVKVNKYGWIFTGEEEISDEEFN